MNTKLRSYFASCACSRCYAFAKHAYIFTHLLVYGGTVRCDTCMYTYEGWFFYACDRQGHKNTIIKAYRVFFLVLAALRELYLSSLIFPLALHTKPRIKTGGFLFYIHTRTGVYMYVMEYMMGALSLIWKRDGCIFLYLFMYSI